jgi:hypothetical protein
MGTEQSLESLAKDLAMKCPEAGALEDSAVCMGKTVDLLLDDLARHVAEGYLTGTYSWEFGDQAMNHLYQAAYVSEDIGLPKYAMEVFLAFDEGEYKHKDSPEMDGEPRTRSLLLAIES